MMKQQMTAFFDELQKIAEDQDKQDRLVRAAKGFVAGALPTAAALRFLIQRAEAAKEGIKAVRGLQPNIHSWLQSAGGAAAGIAGAARALKSENGGRRGRKAAMQVATQM